jgi:hypothetical protein
MRRFVLGAVAGVAVAIGVLMLLSAVAPVLTPLGASQSTSPTAVQGTTPAQRLAQIESVAEHLDALTPPTRAQAVSEIESMSPATLAGFLSELPTFGPAIHLTAAEVKADAGLITAASWEDYIGPVLLGCGTGAILGASAGPAGAGAGCVVGAIVGGLEFQWGLGDASAQSNGQEKAWVQSMLAEVNNEVQLLSASYQTELSELNSTVYALETEADAAALAQIGNATFSPAQDLAQSGVAAQLETLQYANGAMLDHIFSLFGSWLLAQYTYNSGVKFRQGTSSYEIEFGDGGFGSGGTSAGGLGAVNQYYVDTTPGYVFIAQGATWGYEGSVTTCQLTGESTGAKFSFSQTGSWQYVTNFTGPSDVYEVAGTDCAFESQGDLLGISPGSDGVAQTQEWAEVSCSQGTDQNPAVCSPYQIEVEVEPSETFVGCEDTCSDEVTPTYEMGTSVWVNDQNEYTSLMYEATTSAQTYWSFLRNLGYTSESAIPADCIIPYPSQVLGSPAVAELGNLTVSQATSLYSAWLNGLATFFDTPPGVNDTYCAGHHPFPGVGSLPWGNLAVNATGFVYVPNGTVYPHETFGDSPADLATWAVNGSIAVPNVVNGSAAYGAQSCWTPTPPTTAPPALSSACTASSAKAESNRSLQLLAWPTVETVKVPVGELYEIPKNDPLSLFVTQASAFYSLTGNGTAVSQKGLSVDSSSAGDALYLTSCTVNGNATSDCTLSLSTINGTVANLSCASGNGGGSCQGPSGIVGGFPNPLSALGGVFCYLLSLGASTSCSSPLESFLVGLLGAIVLVVAIGVLLYVVVYAAEGRRRGGGGTSAVFFETKR